MRVCRVRWPDYWRRAARWVSPGRSCKHSLTAARRPGILGVNNGASFAIVLGAALFGFSTPLEQLFAWHLAARLSHR